jgi:hypothetical protein
MDLTRRTERLFPTESEHICDLERAISHKDGVLEGMALVMAGYATNHLDKLKDPSITFEKAVETLKRAEANVKHALVCIEAVRA